MEALYLLIFYDGEGLQVTSISTLSVLSFGTRFQQIKLHFCKAMLTSYWPFLTVSLASEEKNRRDNRGEEVSFGEKKSFVWC